MGHTVIEEGLYINIHYACRGVSPLLQSLAAVIRFLLPHFEVLWSKFRGAGQFSKTLLLVCRVSGSVLQFTFIDHWGDYGASHISRRWPHTQGEEYQSSWVTEAKPCKTKFALVMVHTSSTPFYTPALNSSQASGTNVTLLQKNKQINKSKQA